MKKVFLKIAKFTGKKEIVAQVFSCEFCDIFKNTFFTKHLRFLSPNVTEFRISTLRTSLYLLEFTLFLSVPCM